MFDILDVDRSGTLTFDELHRAATVLGRGEGYTLTSFHQLDKNRSGSIDFTEMLKAFFPLIPMRSILKFHREHGKIAEAMNSTKERIGEKNYNEICQQYAFLSSMPGGCSCANMLAMMSPFMKQHKSILEDVFHTYDENGDGCLSLEEYLEMSKFSYTPYARAPPNSGSSDHLTSDGRFNSDDSSAGGGFTLAKLARLKEARQSNRKLPEIAVYGYQPPPVLLSGREGARYRANRYAKLTELLGSKFTRHDDQ